MINLMQLPANEAERLAYAEGFTGTAELFGRIAALEAAAFTLLGELEVLGGDLDPGVIEAANKLREVANETP